jgi:hypothetical protein
MRKLIDTKGNVTMEREAHDDLIATLEQENRQLHARNQRLMQELEAAVESTEQDAISELRAKLNMSDNEKFEVFRTATKSLAKCFEPGNKGVLIADIGNKVSIMGINAEIHEVAIMALATAEKLNDVIDDLQDEDRVIN